MNTKLPVIESVQNATIKDLARLSTKKERDRQGLFLIEGLHLLEEAAAAGLLEHVYQLQTLDPFRFQSAGSDRPVPVTLCSQPVLNRLSAQKSDARYIGVCRKPDLSFEAGPSMKKILLLDRVQDPGNVGTLIRSACSFGLDAVILSSDCADPYGPKTIQSTQGALFHIPVFSADLLQTIQTLRSQALPVYGAALHQNSIELHDLSIPDGFALIIGNEGQGISQSVLDACTQLVHIEMAAFESLNAAIAGSILMYAFQFPSSGS